MKTAELLRIVRALCALRRRVAKSGNPLLLAALDRANFEAGRMVGLSLKD